MATDFIGPDPQLYVEQQNVRSAIKQSQHGTQEILQQFKTSFSETVQTATERGELNDAESIDAAIQLFKLFEPGKERGRKVKLTSVVNDQLAHLDVFFNASAGLNPNNNQRALAAIAAQQLGSAFK